MSKDKEPMEASTELKQLMEASTELEQLRRRNAELEAQVADLDVRVPSSQRKTREHYPRAALIEAFRKVHGKYDEKTSDLFRFRLKHKLPVTTARYRVTAFPSLKNPSKPLKTPEKPYECVAADEGEAVLFACREWGIVYTDQWHFQTECLEAETAAA